MNKITLGTKVKDTITGFTGIAIARTEHLNGAPQVCVEGQGLNEDQLPVGEVWFNESRLVAAE